MTDPAKTNQGAKTNQPGKQNQAGQPEKPEANQNSVEPSGPKGENPATAGPGPTHVVTKTPENREGEINPSAPNDSTTSAGTARGDNKV